MTKMAEGEDEEEELAQWMPICDDCDNPVEHYCTTCGDKLCTDCKDHHLSRRKNRDHQVVPYSAGMRAAQKSTSTCTKHPGERYQMFCKPCQVPVCTPCVTQSHADHSFMSINDAFSAAREKVTSDLEKMTTIIRPRVMDECENAKKAEADVVEMIATTEDEMKNSAKQLHQIVESILENSLKKVTDIKEKDVMPLLRKRTKTSEDISQNLEKAIKEYENNLRSSDPIDLISFMRGRQDLNPESFFPSTDIQEILIPTFQTASVSRETIQSQFGSLVLRKSGYITPKASTQKLTETEKNKEETVDLGIMKSPERLSEFTIRGSHFEKLVALIHFQDRIWVSGFRRKILLVDRDGNVLHTIDPGCTMYQQSGMYSTNDSELIFGDVDGKKVNTISRDFRITTVFTTGYSKPYGICQLHSGEWVVCMPDDGVLRVYDRAGKVVRDIGKGHLLGPYYVTVNKVNDDICVSDSGTQVVVFSISGEKRFTYKGEGSPGPGFNPRDLCCDQLGNILITDCDNHRVHIIDKDCHFLQYLVSGGQKIYNPISIDIDDRGYAWIGELLSRKMKCFKYFI